MISISLVFIQASQATEQIKALAKDKTAHQEIEAAKGMMLVKLLMNYLLLKAMVGMIGSI
jgi:hypothetical protein